MTQPGRFHRDYNKLVAIIDDSLFYKVACSTVLNSKELKFTN